MKVYLVDDEPLVLASLQATLAGRYDTVPFASAEGLLGEIDDLPPGIALVDMALPSMDGHALQRELAHRDAPVVIVFLTGRGSVPDAVDAIQHGAVDFLCKPIRRDALLAALDRATERLAMLLDTRCRAQPFRV